MEPTTYPQVNELLRDISASIRNVFPDSLVGLYLSGSLVWGDFDENASDIDLMAVLSRDASDAELKKLQRVHVDVANTHPQWKDRIEVGYVSARVIKHVTNLRGTMVNVTPGEPIRRIPLGREWIMHWYLFRQQSISVVGPDPKTIIEPISKALFVQSLRDHISAWNTWVNGMHDRRAQAAYVILTVFRALYAYAHGQQVSKKRAAIWAKEEYPQWRQLIDQALEWREAVSGDSVDERTFDQMIRLIDFAKACITAAKRDGRP